MRLLALLTLCSVLNLSGVADNDIAKAILSKTDNRVTRVKCMLISTYHVVNNCIDYVLTVKGATKTLILLTPFFYLYCQYFDASPINDLINRILRSSGQVEGWWEYQKMLGKSDAFWELLKDDPAGVATMYLHTLLDKLLSGQFNPFKLLNTKVFS